MFLNTSSDIKVPEPHVTLELWSLHCPYLLDKDSGQIPGKKNPKAKPCCIHLIYPPLVFPTGHSCIASWFKESQLFNREVKTSP